MAGYTDLVGGIGVAVIIGTYFLLQIGRLGPTSPRYSVLNALGALLIMYSLRSAWNLPAFLIELFWVLVSLIGLVRALLLRRGESR
jgi:hypothetical protein